jgi:hypothetical protein
VDEAGNCLDQQLLATHETADAGGIRAMRWDSPRVWLKRVRASAWPPASRAMYAVDWPKKWRADRAEV